MPKSPSISEHRPASGDAPIDEATRQIIADLEHTVDNQQALITKLKSELSSLVDDMRQRMRQ